MSKTRNSGLVQYASKEKQRKDQAIENRLGYFYANPDTDEENFEKAPAHAGLARCCGEQNDECFVLQLASYV